MITEDNKKLAQWAMDFALKNGCQAAKVILYANSNTSFELRDAKMDRLQQASECGLGLNLYVDGRYGNYSTNRLNKAELEKFIKNGIESTRYLATDEFRVLPDPERYYKGGKPDLKLFDDRISGISPDDKVAIARAAAEEALGKDSRIISVESSYSDGENASYRLISNGFEGESKSTWYSVSTSVAIKGEGEARPSDYWYGSSLFYDALPKTGIGAKALERVLRKLGQKKVQSGKYTMVVDPMNSGRMLNPVLSALYGSSLQQKNSFLIDKLEQKVVSDKLTLIDDPHVVGATGSRYFDGEGVATKRCPIFENGVLKTYFFDTYNAKKMGVAPTISGPSRLVLTPGDKDLNGLIADVSKGILVTGLNGGNSNSNTGDFSYGIEGFLIENGKLTQPVNEMNVTGNFLTLWSSLAAIGNDAHKDRSWLIPSLVFEGVDFSGL
ncbi:TldD/PmbA family protein [uncultured Bacteroides sp.]|uniref:TldD/PmbA family protein n=1 Tax=uncultured Bacteroides sp. TaxID=162156 RepID=UPI0025D8805B|nr:TldD/PmbA family protein [uncultured Bacteroides sp.]